MRKLALALLLAASLPACKKETPAPPSPTTPSAAVAPTPPDDEDKGLVKLTAAEVDHRRSEPNFYVFDNNTKERFDEGHVPGAKWVDPSQLTAAVLPADKNATLVFYCANPSCSACHVGARAAMKLGYTKVYIMPEGIMGWEAAKLPTERAKA